MHNASALRRLRPVAIDIRVHLDRSAQPVHSGYQWYGNSEHRTRTSQHDARAMRFPKTELTSCQPECVAGGASQLDINLY